MPGKGVYRRFIAKVGRLVYEILLSKKQPSSGRGGTSASEISSCIRAKARVEIHATSRDSRIWTYYRAAVKELKLSYHNPDCFLYIHNTIAQTSSLTATQGSQGDGF